MFCHLFVEEQDAYVVEIEGDAHSRMLLHAFPHGRHALVVVDAVDDKDGTFAGEGGACLEAFFHGFGAAVVVDVHEVDPFAVDMRGKEHVGVQQYVGVAGIVPAGLQVETGCGVHAGVDYSLGSCPVDQPEEQAFDSFRLVGSPFPVVLFGQCLLLDAQYIVVVVASFLVHHLRQEEEGERGMDAVSVVVPEALEADEGTFQYL